MNWDDLGFLLSKNKYNENSLIAEFYTKEHGKISGIIFGGTSKKVKNYLQIGNKLYINYNSKTENRIGYFKVEIDQALSPIYFDNPQKLACIAAAMNLVKILNAEAQKNIYIFELIEKFYFLIKSENWLKEYIFWELELFKAIGYDLDLLNLVDKNIINGKIQYVTKSYNEKKIVPNFLINRNPHREELSTLLIGLKLVTNFLEKSILKPKNLYQPVSRIQFINSLR